MSANVNQAIARARLLYDTDVIPKSEVIESIEALSMSASFQREYRMYTLDVVPPPQPVHSILSL